MCWAAHFVEVCCYLHAKRVLACLGRLDDSGRRGVTFFRGEPKHGSSVRIAL